MIHRKRTSSIISALKLSALFLLAILFLRCNNDVNVPDGAFDERTVDLSGTWTVASVLQNGNDITDRMEFSRIELQLNSDAEGPSDYSIENEGLPFITTSNGDWSYDDNTYPTQMQFASGGSESTATFTTPPISGSNSFTISFALGCPDNLYTYILTRQ